MALTKAAKPKEEKPTEAALAEKEAAPIAVPAPAPYLQAPRQRPFNVTKMRASQRYSGGYRPPEENRVPMFDGSVDGRIIPDAGMPTETIVGMLDMRQDGSGILRADYRTNDSDAYISSSQVRRFRLRPGDMVEGPARKPKENERYWGLLRVDKINEKTIEEAATRPDFSRLTPVYPNERINLELGPNH